MAYPLSSLQKTANYIAQNCRYESGHTLEKSRKRRLGVELAGCFLEEAQKNNPKVLVIDKGNLKFKGLIEALADERIQLPELTTFIIKPNGQSYAKRKIHTLNEQERMDAFIRAILEDLEVLQEDEMQFFAQAVMDAIEDHKQTSPEQQLIFEKDNEALADFFLTLAHLGIEFPYDQKYALKASGESYKIVNDHYEAIYEGMVEITSICPPPGKGVKSHSQPFEPFNKDKYAFGLASHSTEDFHFALPKARGLLYDWDMRASHIDHRHELLREDSKDLEALLSRCKL